MALASSSSSTSEWQYDVFLSFRGEDTRTNFTDHLYSALNRAGICTFRDGNDLERGEEIGTELRKAIEKSRYSIIVFSKNYASSSWCLDELAHIMKCRKTVGQIVLPVFYDVEPSDVRKQKRSYEEAFGGHEDRFKEQKEKLQRWRSALQEAADLKGVDVRNDADRHESMIIENIVKDISNELHPRRLKVTINPVGIDSRANVVKSLLNHDSVDVRIVGIYGLGGIGKTTIAKEVYNSIISKFEGSSFLANVRENSKPKGIVDLQNQLLSDILNGKHEKIYSSDRGLKLIEERLCNIRVLIVLDDVDKSEQINKILGNLHDWLSHRSRIIITTRIKDLLPSRVYWQYQPNELNKLESLRLFSINAFGEWHPVEEYMECSKSFVDYCGGIPLALEVLGSYLSGQSVDVWESKLEKLKKTPHASVQDVLEISFHSLDKMERDIFLDIACFFIGNDKNYVISILDGCGFFAVDGINTLIKRCLLKIEFKNKLEMHDLIRDMGRQIVSQESKEYGERSRVWHHEEAFELLQDETGLWENGIYSLFLLSSEIPSLYSHQSCFCDSVTFNVPPLHGRRIQGVIISVVYARSEFFDTSPPLSRISILNKNRMSSYYPTAIFLNEAHEDIMWLIYWSIENLGNGDAVKVEIDRSRRPFLVKKCGVNLLYPQNDQVSYWAQVADWASGRLPGIQMKRSKFIWTRLEILKFSSGTLISY